VNKDALLPRIKLSYRMARGYKEVGNRGRLKYFVGGHFFACFRDDWYVDGNIVEGKGRPSWQCPKAENLGSCTCRAKLVIYCLLNYLSCSQQVL
jgi:hypothetical protein